MSPAIGKAAFNLAIVLPTLLITAALCWFALKRLGKVKTGVRFRPHDMSTWPLSFVLADTAIYVIALSIVSALPDPILQAVPRLLIILLAALLFAVLASFAFKRLGIVKSGIPLSPVLIDAIAYTLIYSVFVLFGASTRDVIELGITIFLVYSVAPRLAARFLKTA